MKISKIPGVKKIAIAWCLILLAQIFMPTITYALTSGPSQPEVQSFEPVGTTQMVDLQSGDFNYNIPLLTVGSYPINIAYHAGVGMEDEASWVGLGWNLNPGAINRNMRGLPDDFSGEVIEKELDVKDNITVEFGLGPEFEIGGFGTIALETGLRYNNYKGLAITQNVNIAPERMGAFNMNLGLGFDSGEGISVSPTIGLSHSMSFSNGKGNFAGGINVGAPYNSRTGLSQLTFSRNFSANLTKLNMRTFKGFHGSVGVGSSGSLVSFNTPSYITSTQNNSRSYAFNLKIGLGAEILPFLDTKIDIKGSYSKVKTLGDRSLPAYGYLNHHLTQPGISLMDFNREKDGPYYKSSNALPLTSVTYDSYSISGQGVGGAYRPHRNEIGFIADASSSVDYNSDEFGGDIAPGVTPVSFKVGVNFSHQQTDGRAGLWSGNNSADDQFYFGKRPNSSSNAVQAKFEPTYFQQVGELTANKGRYEGLAKNAPLHFDLTGSNKSPSLHHTLKDKTGATRTINGIEADRALRSQPMSALTIKEAKRGAVNKKVQHYLPGLQLNANGTLKKIEKSIHNYTEGFNVKENQLFQLMVNRPDGARYIYGLPAYNTTQEDVIFNASSEASKDHAKPTVRYSSSDIYDNHNGVDHYFTREKMPAFAYTHLLTSVLSSDFADRTGDGPSDDDYGDWVKFNYSNIAGNMSGTQTYKWRFPFEEFNSGYGIANFNEGLKSQSKDDKANFTYGEKELWYTHSIESRSHIAIFFTSDRNDAKGVKNSNGRTDGASSRPSMQKLDRIEYYAKHDLALNGHDAVPIKTVHFEYDYSLCPGVPNNLSGNGGKLTLKKLYFHYGNSRKGEFSSYKFGYFDDANGDGVADLEYQNPPYKRRSKDRWGNYKEDALTTSEQYAPSSIGNASIPLANSDFPYAEQNDEIADQNAQAWNLKRIELPSGGAVQVTYEADDYAYVQDRRANQMFTLRGTSQGVPDELDDLSNNLHSGGEFFNHLVIELPENLSSSTLNAKDEFYYNYLDGVDHLYFRSLIQIKGGNYEFVPGYTKIEDYGVFQDTAGGQVKDFGWIRVKGVGYDENGNHGSVNPIAKAGWQFARMNIPTLVYPGSNVEAGLIQNVIQGLIGLLNELPRMISGLNRSLRREGFCKRIVPNKSWIRLNTPDYVKKGGGCRVQKIEMSDNWSSMDAAGQNATYGQQYFYKTVETTAGGEQKLISSGVATYEPVLGNDENPFKTPITFNESRWLAPDNHHYIERPLGETFFPSASVGYSNVIVADIRPDEHVKRTATGYSVNEFYTAKDFPYKTDHNVGERKLYKPSPLSSLFRFRSKDYAHVSQGYTIQLNDMHGKQKASWSYAGALPYNTSTGDLDISTTILTSGNRIAGTEYVYKVDDDNALNNEVKVINPDGSISQEYVGIESELVMDFKENRTTTSNVEIRGDLDMWIIPFFIPIPVPVVSVIPSYSESETLFRSAVTTKVVNQHGLLEKVRVHKEGSIVETQNLLYDSETGEVLLTSLNNEYKEVESDVDPLANEENTIYGLKYPAHWAYEGMGPAYQNIGAEQSVQTLASGNNSLPEADKIFYPGDEVLGQGTLIFSFFGLEFPFPYEQKFWVSAVDANHVKFILENGELLTDGYELFPGNPYWTLDNDWDMKVVRSGYRNQQTTPIATMTSLKNPATYFLGSGSTNTGSQSMTAQANALEVVDFSAQEFSENWQMFCNGTEITTMECVCDIDVNNIYAISDLFSQQYQAGELWTTQQSDISALTSTDFPWDFEESNCTYQHEHYSNTDLSHVRNVDHVITNLKISDNHPVFATSQSYDQHSSSDKVVMAYVKDEQVEVAFYRPETTPSNSDEEIVIRKLYKPEDDLNIVELIELREHNGEVRYALLYEFVDRNEFSSAVLTIFDEDQVYWSRQFLDEEIVPMDISTYDIYSMYFTYFSQVSNSHHLMKLNVADGTVEYDNEITTTGELTSKNTEVLPFVIENKGATKRDKFLTARSTLVRVRDQLVNRLFVHEATDEGSTISMNRTSVWNITNASGDSTRFFPTDLIKHDSPEGQQQNARVVPYHFGAGKTSNNEVFIFRVSEDLVGNYYLFDPNINIESVSLNHTHDPQELILNISPKVDVTDIEGAMSVTISDLFGEGFNPQIVNISRFDGSNSIRTSTIDESRIMGSRTLSPTVEVDPVYRTGVLRLGNYLEDNGHLSSLDNCFDAYTLDLYDRTKNQPGNVIIELQKIRPTLIDVVMRDEFQPKMDDMCCPESITHHVSYSRSCDTCSYTFYLPENADYCLMDLTPICSSTNPSLRANVQCVVPVIPDYAELLDPDCDATDHRYFTYFEVDDESSVFDGDIVQIVMKSNCFEPFNCAEEPTVTLCGGEDGTVINPYLNGARGNWRPNKSFIHKQVDRLTASANDDPSLAVQGYYEQYDQFWNRPSNTTSKWAADDDNYIKSSEITKYSPYGEVLEEQDALGISGAILTGYDKKLPIAVGGNLKYREMGFDGFEEYAFYQAPDQCHAGFHFDLNAYANLDQKVVHTGYYSLRVKSSHKAKFKLECAEEVSNNNTSTPYAIERCADCLPNFNPAYRTADGAENRYVFDCWIHQLNNQGAAIINQINSAGAVVESSTITPSGPKIEDWQRAYGFFKLHPAATELEVVFKNGGSSPMYVDDVRTYPFDGNMKSFVYDPASLQLMAELDGNNHATLYEYDEEWNLIRIKKETERGIVTIQEHRTNDRIDRD